MTNHIDPGLISKAKEWADHLNAQRVVYGGMASEARAAAEVIDALPDTVVDGDKLREVVAKHHIDMDNDLMADLGELLPDPTSRTLAEMTPAEQDECIGMAAAVGGFRTWYIVGRDPDTYGQWITCTKGGRVQSRIPKVIDPLPDLPRMVWPDEHPPATDTEETPEPEQPRPEDVPAGEVWMIRPCENADPVPAVRVHQSKYGPGKRWAHYVTGAPMLRFEDDEGITLVSRLFPEVQA